MGIKAQIQQVVFRNHIWMERLDSRDELLNFISRFRQKLISCDLLRIGGVGDGGYLHPAILDKISYCFSPGVSDTANFEKHLSDEYGVTSFLADASVPQSPVIDDNLNFIPKFLGSYSQDEFITLSDWMLETSYDKNKGVILQMDIEGGEYPVLIYENSDVLDSFSAMIIEFHGLQRLYEKSFLRMMSAIFDKIYQNFSICHVHPNNCCGIAELDEIRVPRTMEVTFIRNDMIPHCKNHRRIQLPHPLDSKNVEGNEDIAMPEAWWKG